MKKINCFLVCIYDEDFKNNLKSLIESTEYIESWSYIVNETVKYLPPVHLYIKTKKRLKAYKFEELLRSFNLSHSFIDCVINVKSDVRSVFDYVGHHSGNIVTCFN